MRLAALFIVVFTCLVAAGPAAAHSRAPTVALDYRLAVAPSQLAGVHVDVVDGDRSLRVQVDPPHRLVVRGLLGEPALRFGPDGVWANRASPTATSPATSHGQSGGGATRVNVPVSRADRPSSTTGSDHGALFPARRSGGGARR